VDGMNPDESELERDLRRVLSDPGYRLPDRLVPLERVHAGAVRRRRRHQAVTATLAAVAVVGLGIGVARPWVTGDSDHRGTSATSNGPTSSVASPSPTASSPSPSVASSSSLPNSSSLRSSAIARDITAAEAHAILAHVGPVTSVTALDDNHWWVSNNASLLATGNDGASFSVVSSDGDPGFCDCYYAAVRFVDRTHGTAMEANSSLETTSDAGKTWEPAARSYASFFALEAGGGKTTWALQLNADSRVHLWRQVDTGSWADVSTLPDSPTTGAQNVQLTVQQDRAVVVWRGAKSINAASFDPSGTIAGPTVVPGCSVTLGLGSLSAGRNAVWLICPTATGETTVRSQDLGASWKPVAIPGQTGHGQQGVVGAIDATHAVVSTQSGLRVVDTAGTTTAGHVPAGVNPYRFTYIGFTNPTHGFALTDKGQLLRSTDGGLTWKVVTYTG
jgi:photosystem II stability/assembly factor-like uncharacterized protein